ncbi:oxidoreductase, Rxyl_3153 family [Frankia torreyi]|uniref:Oxidoreductase, Rxyl_3153 family n=1 Tax=Frankia torreyi TaxID=1856 RepID=A0A0D8BC55_9ACTN|nr:Zn-dependent alcohol dehydrogenase [Frankia sp. ArI3]KJE21741.1 oxidoreductase, Rxyl_3153 family [Frankia torreyi]KQM03288.1 NDMA-dependent alcohol dehydrogenase, Rxyl_3153 family [Frankia sp. CpI1-P]
MKTIAAVLYEAGKPFEIEELEVVKPDANEVLVRYDYSGLCHSDLHMVKGHLPFRPPMVFGHEAAGEILEVGSKVSRLAPGDHFVASFFPVCGRCRWCVTGNSRLCDMGANGLDGFLPGGRFPFQGKNGDYGSMMTLGTFSQYATVHENSVVRIDDDLPLDKAALVGCGVPTGWGSAVNSAGVRPGDTVVIYGIGGIGVNAVQGAAYAGAQHLIAVDPEPAKLEAAKKFGATHTAGSAAEAQDLVIELTRGVGADSTIITVDELTAQVVSDAAAATSKGGTIVVTSMGQYETDTISLSGVQLALWGKRIQGSLYGGCNPMYDIPKILSLYRTGHVKLDELITNVYTLDQVNQGYDDLMAHKNIRGVIAHEH